jgi:flagellar hook protein FlgE
MMPAMYAAISGLEAHQTMLDVTANNLANIDTIGYKAQRTTFESELSELIAGGSGQTAQNGGTNPQQIGLGVQVGSIDNIMSAGSLQSTGNTLDVAIQGQGMLAVGSGTPGATPTAGVPAAGSLQFTRSGNLTTDSQGYLTNANGQYVIGSTTAGGQPNTYLQIPPGSTNVSVGQDGSVTYTDENTANPTYQQTVTAGYISLASFPNTAGLTRDAGSSWSTSANSGAPTFGTPNTGGFSNTQLISGELEQSNVDMANEFTNMIEAERGYQANSSVISTANQMMQTLVQMAQGG